MTAQARVILLRAAKELIGKWRPASQDFDRAVAGRMVFSCLVNADFPDTEALYGQTDPTTATGQSSRRSCQRCAPPLTRMWRALHPDGADGGRQDLGLDGLYTEPCGSAWASADHLCDPPCLIHRPDGGDLLRPFSRCRAGTSLGHRHRQAGGRPPLDSAELKAGLDLAGRALAPDPEGLADRLRGARIVPGGAMDDAALALALQDAPQSMVVVNIRCRCSFRCRTRSAGWI